MGTDSALASMGEEAEPEEDSPVEWKDSLTEEYTIGYRIHIKHSKVLHNY